MARKIGSGRVRMLTDGQARLIVQAYETRTITSKEFAYLHGISPAHLFLLLRPANRQKYLDAQRARRSK